jgi:hypothetical protein
MKGLNILLLLAAGCLMAGTLHADIYEWTDASGVKHFTNYAPPDDARILMKTEEVPYDEAADLARMEADRQYQLQYQLEVARQEIAAREAEIERREAEAERKAAEAERYAQETVREADQYLNDAKQDRWYYRSGGYYGYYRPPYVQHYKHKYRKKSHYGHPGKKYPKKYRRDKHAGHNKYKSPRSSRSRIRSNYSTHRVKARSRGNIGRNYSIRGSSGRHR